MVGNMEASRIDYELVSGGPIMLYSSSMGQQQKEER
jgi:hypothetical protein